MSRENVELVKTLNAAWNSGDLDSAFALMHHDFEWHTGVFPGLDPVYRGEEGFRKFERDFRSTFESLRVTIDEMHDRGERVVAIARFEGRGRDGIDVTAPIAWVTTFRDGLAMRVDVYGSGAEALEAVGLWEGDSLKGE
jgi:ketosteroid isomerase-like protein